MPVPLTLIYQLSLHSGLVKQLVKLSKATGNSGVEARLKEALGEEQQRRRARHRQVLLYRLLRYQRYSVLQAAFLALLVQRAPRRTQYYMRGARRCGNILALLALLVSKGAAPHRTLHMHATLHMR